MKKIIKNKAFTLAEVLITLTIIGVIAALTIPNLMQKWQKQATVSKLQKGYNQINRMAYNIKQNTQCDDVECVDFFKLTNKYDMTKEFIEKAEIKDAKIQQMDKRILYMYCKQDSCSDTKGDLFNYFIKTSDGLGYVLAFRDNWLFYVVVLTEPNAKKFISGVNSFYYVIYGGFKVDAPIWTGKGVYPLRMAKSINEGVIAINSCRYADKGVYSGYSCAGRIMLDGWKMNY